MDPSYFSSKMFGKTASTMPHHPNSTSLAVNYSIPKSVPCSATLYDQ